MFGNGIGTSVATSLASSRRMTRRKQKTRCDNAETAASETGERPYIPPTVDQRAADLARRSGMDKKFMNGSRKPWESLAPFKRPVRQRNGGAEAPPGRLEPSLEAVALLAGVVIVTAIAIATMIALHCQGRL